MASQLLISQIVNKVITVILILHQHKISDKVSISIVSAAKHLHVGMTSI